MWIKFKTNHFGVEGSFLADQKYDLPEAVVEHLKKLKVELEPCPAPWEEHVDAAAVERDHAHAEFLRIQGQANRLAEFANNANQKCKDLHEDWEKHTDNKSDHGKLVQKLKGSSLAQSIDKMNLADFHARRARQAAETAHEKWQKLLPKDETIPEPTDDESTKQPVKPETDAEDKTKPEPTDEKQIKQPSAKSGEPTSKDQQRNPKDVPNPKGQTVQAESK